jgi:chemosensory pili system protein ChpA (sensor histidine kinase/response regulator)
MPKPLALIIEDDLQLNKIFALTLRVDFQTESYMDGTEALNRLSEIVPQLVILDINLPGTSGTEILAHIRADARLEKTRVIVASANERLAEDLYDKADLVLLKPVSPKQLAQLAARYKPSP